jgi:IS5 family transposase
VILTKIFCDVHDFLKSTDYKALTMVEEERKKLGRKQKMTKADVMTILIFFPYSKRTTFKDYYELDVLQGINSAFDNLVSYSRFIELISTVVCDVLAFLCLCCLGKQTEISVIDSTSYEVCNVRRASSHKVFAGYARKGKTSTGWFFGLKIHVVINMYGEITNFCITPGNVHDANEDVVNKLTKSLTGKLIGDRGYLSQKLFSNLWARGLKLITRIRSNMNNKLLEIEEKLLLNKRGIIETVFGKLKEFFHLEHSRHRSTTNFLGHLFAGLCAYKYDTKKPAIFTSPELKIAGF